MWLLLAALGTAAGAGPGGGLNGTYHINYFMSEIEAQVQQQGSAFHMVVRVTQPFSKTNTYTFNGTVKGDQVRASHPDGHRFEGRLLPGARLEGVLHNRWGNDFSLTLGPENKVAPDENQPAAASGSGPAK